VPRGYLRAAARGVRVQGVGRGLVLQLDPRAADLKLQRGTPLVLSLEILHDVPDGRSRPRGCSHPGVHRTLPM